MQMSSPRTVFAEGEKDDRIVYKNSRKTPDFNRRPPFFREKSRKRFAFPEKGSIL
jgi:hypothetical protein